VEGLGKIGSDKAISSLIPMLSIEQHHDIRSNAVIILEKLENEKLISDFRHALTFEEYSPKILEVLAIIQSNIGFYNYDISQLSL
jgi:HEAT repeat protein